MSTTTKLIRVSNDLGIARDLLQCVFMATSALQLAEANPIASTINEVSKRIEKAEARLQAMRDQRCETNAAEADGRAPDVSGVKVCQPD